MILFHFKDFLLFPTLFLFHRSSFQAPISVSRATSVKTPCKKPFIFCRSEAGVVSWLCMMEEGSQSSKFSLHKLSTSPVLSFFRSLQGESLSSHPSAGVYFSVICFAKVIIALRMACFPPQIYWYFLPTVVIPISLFLVSLCLFILLLLFLFLFSLLW